MKIEERHLICLFEIRQAGDESWQLFHPRNDLFYELRDLHQANLLGTLDEKPAIAWTSRGRVEAKKYQFAIMPDVAEILDTAMIALQNLSDEKEGL